MIYAFVCTLDSIRTKYLSFLRCWANYTGPPDRVENKFFIFALNNFIIIDFQSTILFG